MTQDTNAPGPGKALPLAASTSNDRKAEIEQLLNRWNAVQGRLKKAEQISQVAVIPAINELRYAGRILVAAMANVEPTSENGLPSIQDAVVVANQYITNAEHDIADALVYFYQKKADDLNARFGAQTIVGKFEGYAELLATLKLARNLVISSRSKIDSRRENYIKLIEVTEKLNDLYFIFIDADNLLSLEVEHYRSRITLWKTISAVSILIVLATTLWHAFL